VAGQPSRYERMPCFTSSATSVVVPLTEAARQFYLPFPWTTAATRPTARFSRTPAPAMESSRAWSGLPVCAAMLDPSIALLVVPCFAVHGASVPRRVQISSASVEEAPDVGLDPIPPFHLVTSRSRVTHQAAALPRSARSTTPRARRSRKRMSASEPVVMKHYDFVAPSQLFFRYSR